MMIMKENQRRMATRILQSASVVSTANDDGNGENDDSTSQEDTRSKLAENLAPEVSLSYSSIPQYLRSGAFYQALNSDDSEEIFVPRECFKENDTANSLEEFELLLRTMIFWGLDKIPVGLIDFCLREHSSVWMWAPERVRRSGAAAKVCETLVELFRGDSTRYLITAIEKGITEVVEYLVTSNRWDINRSATEVAARAGRVDYLRLLRENRVAWNVFTCTAAAAKGHLDCLIYAHENGAYWDTNTLISAATNRHVDCLNYAIKEGLELRASVCTAVVRNGLLDVLKYLHKHNCPWDEDVTFEAASRGKTECLLYALQNGCEVNKRAAAAACRNGDIATLRILNEYNAPWDSEACLEAASFGNLECLQYLRGHGCSWGKETLEVAAAYGAVDALQFSLDHGCPYDDDLMRRAAWGGHLHCLQYLVEQGLYLDEDGTVFGAALRRGHFTCVQYLIETGCPFLNYEFDDPPRDLPPATKIFEDEFYHSMVYALQRGWCLNDKLIKFVYDNNFANCESYLLTEGLISEIHRYAYSRAAEEQRFMMEQLTYAPIPGSANIKQRSFF